MCDILKCKPYTLRYIEKVLNLNIDRNDSSNRTYDQVIIDKLKLVFELKDHGLNYPAIKAFLEHQNIIVEDAVEETKKDIMLQDKKLNDFIELLTNKIGIEVKKSVNSKFEVLTKEIDNLKLQNAQLQLQLTKEQDEHFTELDGKLTKLREEMNQNSKKSFIEKLFKK